MIIIVQDPLTELSRALVASLPPNTGQYTLIDWSNPNSLAGYTGPAGIRSFPSIVLTMSDQSLGIVDCQNAKINTWTDIQGISTQIVTTQFISPITGKPVSVTTPQDPRVQPVPPGAPMWGQTVIVTPGVQPI